VDARTARGNDGGSDGRHDPPFNHEQGTPANRRSSRSSQTDGELSVVGSSEKPAAQDASKTGADAAVERSSGLRR